MTKLLQTVSLLAAAFLVPLSLADSTITDVIGTHCKSDSPAATSALASCAQPFMHVHDECEKSLLATAVATDDVGINNGENRCICSFYLAASACFSDFCDSIGSSIYIDNYSSCAQGLYETMTAGTTTGSVAAGSTGTGPVTTAPPTAAPSSSPSASKAAATSTKSSGAAGSAGSLALYGSCLAAGAVGVVALYL
ncbi:hypothetical protein B0T19DRAFT_446338 [Cercophora scortea]|uniref:Uncharacterized protein n=1 Tax=Cercophora scortea TaxID=314031 RepID=A0AAE0I334_9PEZI|nr:hypothetical protein B0T19DRAFT_446338 [Cercophora scortea]